MTITKDIWMTLSSEDKKSKVTEALTQLYKITKNEHPLSNKLDQGRLANVKKDLETFVLNTADWEAKPVQHKQFK